MPSRRQHSVQRRRRVGFVLASVHSGAANLIWPGVAEDAERRNVDLLIFPGGRLAHREEHEYLRNDIYDLAGPRTVDGIVSWASAIGGDVSQQEVASFHERYSSVPLVTLNQKIGTSPLNTIDVARGMREIVFHLVHVHRFSVFAFLKGPPHHPSAQERFEAFRDAVTEFGIGLDERLVVSAESWNAGRDAMRELVEQRAMAPGSDFEVVVAASDLLLFDAIRYLNDRGFEVPRDCAATGFNDSDESRMLAPTFTTVRMPFAEQGVAAFRSLLDLVNGDPVQQETCLPTRLVVRQSCGCPADHAASLARSPAGEGELGELDFEALTEEIVDRIVAGNEERDAWVKPLVAELRVAIEGQKPQPFLDTLERVLGRVAQIGGEIQVWQDVVSLMRARYLDAKGGETDLYAEELFSRGRLVVSEAFRRAYAYHQWHESNISKVLGDLDKALLMNRDRAPVGTILSRYLPQLGIRSAYIVTYEGGIDRRERYGGILAGFRCDGPGGEPTLFGEAGRARPFPVSTLLPDHLFPEQDAGTYMVLPLYIQAEPLGYAVIRVGVPSGRVYEEIRSILSSALKGIYLFEEVSRARLRAERAERTRARFFANANAALRGPLEDALHHAERGDVEQVRRVVREQLDSVDDLVELSSAEIDELAVEPTIQHARRLILDVVSEYGSRDVGPKVDVSLPPMLPLLFVDRSRVARIIGTMIGAADASSVSLTAAIRPPFLEVRVACDNASPRTAPETRRASETGSPAIELAKRLAILHGGELESVGPSGHGYRLRIPLPNLAGSLAPPPDVPEERCLLLSPPDQLPPELTTGTATGSATEEVAMDSCRAAAWYVDRADFEEWIRVRSLRHSSAFVRLPFAVFSDAPTENFATLDSFLAACSIAAGSGPVVYVGSAPETTMRTAVTAARDTVHVENVETLQPLLMDFRPAAIVVTRLEPQSVRALRAVPMLEMVPIIVIAERLVREEDVSWCEEIPRLTLLHREVALVSGMHRQLEAVRSERNTLSLPTAQLVRRAQLYLDLHMKEVTRWKVADSVSVSEDYLSRIFHKATGFSPWEYLIRMRVGRAYNLLRSGGASVGEVARSTGFSDHAYFCRVFRSITGASPTEARTIDTVAPAEVGILQ